METHVLKISQIRLNGDNPRTITTDKFRKLIDSILVFPEMLNIRPIVVDGNMVALGGNMRCNALKSISKMGIEEITDRMQGVSDFTEKTVDEQKKLATYWAEWLDKPTAPVIIANGLTEDEKKQFIIKDNSSFGKWDYDLLANSWDGAKLGDWGIDVWDALPMPREEEKHDTTEREDDIISDEEIDGYGNEDRLKKIEVIIPNNLSDKADAIKAIIIESLYQYSDVKIK